MAAILLQIFTPERQALEKQVESVSLPAAKGEMGVLPGHIPYLAHLTEGVLRFREAGKEGFFAVSGGFAEVKRDRVSVFAETAELSDEIDEERARQALEKARAEAQRRDLDPLTLAAAEAAAKRAAVRIKVAEMRKLRGHVKG